jgi:hypothetical protein
LLQNNSANLATGTNENGAQSEGAGMVVLTRPSLAEYGRAESITSISLESSNLEKEQAKLLENLF